VLLQWSYCVLCHQDCNGSLSQAVAVTVKHDLPWQVASHQEALRRVALGSVWQPVLQGCLSVTVLLPCRPGGHTCQWAVPVIKSEINTDVI
jgi:hypothetical protein